jgi:hypothetical protein
MAHQYLRPVPVVVRGGAPAGFRWKGIEYAVAEVLATWHLMDKWWAHPAEENPRQAASDRTYYRVRCPDQQVFELYHDAASGLWVLDRVHD